MRPQDIDKVANLVVGSLANAGGIGILGCGSVTEQQAFNPAQECDVEPFYFVCDEGSDYDCGGLGDFHCCDGFTCTTDFNCPGDARFTCPTDQDFNCLGEFSCGTAGDTFALTSNFCGLPELG
jgi:hypothetical protein